MKKLIITLIVICFSMFYVACGNTDHTGESKIPSSSSSLEESNYEDVQQLFENEGFTNIKTEPIEDLITGWITKDGEVEEVSVGGEVSFSSGEWVPSDTQIIIRYHTFPAEEEQTEQDTTDASTTTTVEEDNQETTTVDTKVSVADASNAESTSKYDLAYARELSNYTLIYLIDTDSNEAVSLSTDGGTYYYITYTGDIASGFAFFYDEGDDSFYEYLNCQDPGDDTLMVMTSDYDNEEYYYYKADVSDAEQYLP